MASLLSFGIRWRLALTGPAAALVALLPTGTAPAASTPAASAPATPASPVSSEKAVSGIAQAAYEPGPDPAEPGGHGLVDLLVRGFLGRRVPLVPAPPVVAAEFDRHGRCAGIAPNRDGWLFVVPGRRLGTGFRSVTVGFSPGGVRRFPLLGRPRAVLVASVPGARLVAASARVTGTASVFVLDRTCPARQPPAQPPSAQPVAREPGAGPSTPAQPVPPADSVPPAAPVTPAVPTAPGTPSASAAPDAADPPASPSPGHAETDLPADPSAQTTTASSGGHRLPSPSTLAGIGLGLLTAFGAGAYGILSAAGRTPRRRDPTEP